MKKRIILVLAILLILAGIFILIRIAAITLNPSGRGGLQVTSNLKATVFLDNKPIGTTPFNKSDPGETIPSGMHDLKIVPEDKNFSPYSAKIDINPGVLTAVDRTFLPGALASSYILTLEKTNKDDAEVFIASIPDGALVFVDGESKGVTPFSEKLSPSEHEIEIDKAGFSKKTVRIRAVKSYKLVLNVVLGVEGEDEIQNTTTPTPQVSESPTIAPSKNSVIIKDTPTGFLRVRATASTGSQEIGRVIPGEAYEFTDENNSWYKIVLSDGKEGWISKTYAEEVTQ